MPPTKDLEGKGEECIAEQAAEWLARLRTPGPRDRLEFLKWLKESPQQVRELLIATTWDRLLVHLDPERSIDIRDVINSTSSTVVTVRPGTGIPVVPRPQRAKTHRRFGWPWLVGISGTAAALLLLATNLIELHQFKTATGEQRARLFRVHAGDRVIQAIGTQLDVYRQSGRTDVAVIEGAVGIFSASTQEHLSQLAERTQISAGELVRIVADGAITAPAPVNVVEVNAWQQRRLIFRRRTLQEIADEFNRYNRNLQIRVEGHDLRTIRFSGVFDADDPESLLKYLEADGRFAFERVGDEVVIRPQPQETPRSSATKTI